MSDFVPSHFQQAIYDHVVAQWAALKAWRRSPSTSPPPRNLIVRATAGSGKSSTLRTVCALIPDARIDVVSFSARVAKDAEKRLPPNASSVTLHAVGKRALEAFFGRKYRSGSERRGNDAELDGRKSQRIIAALKERGAISQYVPAAALAKLVSKAKGVGIVPMVMDSQSRATVGSQGWTCTPLCEDTDAAWQALCAHHQIEASDESKLIYAARVVLAESLKGGTALIDFDDMVYLAAVLDAVTFERRDVVMVDELQDLDAMQRRMVLRMCGDEGRVDRSIHHRPDPAAPLKSDPQHRALFIGVGDPRQAIFSWRGADADSMDLCGSLLACDELPLMYCYRCPTSHVALARQYEPAIEAAPGAAEGVVNYPQGAISLSKFSDDYDEDEDHDDPLNRGGIDIKQFTATSETRAVICRKNAPLVTLAFALMKARVPCRVLGRDFGKGIAALLESTKSSDPEVALRRLGEKLGRLQARDAKDKTLDGEPSEDTMRLRDQIEVVRAVFDNLLDRHAGTGEQQDSGDGRGNVLTHPVSVGDVVTEIDHLFGEDAPPGAVVLSSAHKSKGLEFDHVFWMDEDNCQPNQKMRPWMVQETLNIRFVCLTRARKSITFIYSSQLPGH